MDQNARKVRNQDINPCIEESDASQKCLDAYNYDKSMCSAYFQRYKNCRKYWTLVPTFSLLMDVFVNLCCSFRLPVWIASLLHVAKHLRSDCARRKKVYRLLQRKLMLHRVGVKEGSLCQPTYVYPKEVKMLLRSAFPQDVCDYPDPCHEQVVYITVEDLHNVQIN